LAFIEPLIERDLAENGTSLVSAFSQLYWRIDLTATGKRSVSHSLAEISLASAAGVAMFVSHSLQARQQRPYK
jgi:hypothetical protein